MSRQTEVEAVDRLLLGDKRLSGAAPEFGPTNFNRRGRYENCARWPLVDDIGVANGAEFLFVARAAGEHSISVLWRQRPIYRLDIVGREECKPNPHFSQGLGLPSRVCGPHVHTWENNRAHVLSQTVWDLPCREPLPPQVRRFDQAWLWLAGRLNVVLTSEERVFQLPMALI
ncbi:MAG: hypothetical protein E7774_11895 [Bradyrhizobium sp.]|nr:MAG: hypothetical protein E7774_11895 [Bradyrhizobium sp.]